MSVMRETVPPLTREEAALAAELLGRAAGRLLVADDPRIGLDTPERRAAGALLRGRGQGSVRLDARSLADPDHVPNVAHESDLLRALVVRLRELSPSLAALTPRVPHEEAEGGGAGDHTGEKAPSAPVPLAERRETGGWTPRTAERRPRRAG